MRVQQLLELVATNYKVVDCLYVFCGLSRSKWNASKASSVCSASGLTPDTYSWL